VKLYYFCDECIEPAWLETLCNSLIEDDLQVRWMMEARLEQEFTPELCRKLYQAGCRMLAFGLESGCQRILDLMDKGIKVHTASKALMNCAEAGIWNHVFGIIGFPTETPEEANQTLQFIGENIQHIRSAGCHTFVLERHSRVWSNPAHFKINKVTPHDDGDLSLNFDYSVQKGMNQERALEIAREFQERLGEKHLDLLRFGRFLVPYIAGYLRRGENHS
jgi:radical SAM superfamily enzyme YgiQ (UPF0313 family)